MTDVVVDTDVASTILKGQLPVALARQLAGQRLAVTFVAVGELTGGRTCTAEDRNVKPACSPSSPALLSSYPTAFAPPRSGARSRPTPGSAGVSRPVNDSRIAACCLVRGLPLATFNIKDYADFAEQRHRTCPLRTLGVECLVERTTACRRSPKTQDANRRPR